MEHVRRAVESGADIIVVGGGITSSKDQRRTAHEMLETIRGGAISGKRKKPSNG